MDGFLKTLTVKELNKLIKYYNLKGLNKKSKKVLLEAVTGFLKNNDITNTGVITDILTEKPEKLKGLETLTRDELRKRYKDLGLKGGLNSMDKRDIIKAITTFVTDGPLEEEDIFKDLNKEIDRLMAMGVSKYRLKKIIDAKV